MADEATPSGDTRYFTKDEALSAARRMDELQEDMDHGMVVAQVFENVGDSLARMDGEQACPAAAMEALEQSMLGLLKSVGMTPEGATVALEDFRGASTAMESAEAVKEVAKKIWDKLVAFIRAIVKAVKDFIAKVALSNGRMRKHAEQLRAEVSKHKDEMSDPTKKIESSKFNKFLTTPDGYAQGSDFLPALKKHTHLISEVQNHVLGVGKDAMGSLKAALDKALRSDMTFLEDVSKVMTPLFASPGSHISHNKEISAKYGERFSVNEYPMMFGGESMFVVLMNAITVTVDNPPNPSEMNKVVVFTDANAAITSYEGTTEALPPSVMDAVLSEIISSTEKMDGLIREANAMVKELDDIGANAGKKALASLVDGAKDTTNLGMVCTMAFCISKLVQSSIKNVQLYDLKVTAKSLDYVKASLRLTSKAFSVVDEDHLKLGYAA
jgi:hypothetical protein